MRVCTAVGGCSRRRDLSTPGAEACLQRARAPTSYTSACLVLSRGGLEEQRLQFPKFRPVSMMVSWSCDGGKDQWLVFGFPHVPGAVFLSNTGAVAGEHRDPDYWAPSQVF